jgi:hypothetical protein
VHHTAVLRADHVACGAYVCRFGRASGLSGLAGMETISSLASGVGVLRPLLSVPKVLRAVVPAVRRAVRATPTCVLCCIACARFVTCRRHDLRRRALPWE